MMFFSFQNLRYCQNESDSHVLGHGQLGCACVRWVVATRGWIPVRWIACSRRGARAYSAVCAGSADRDRGGDHRERLDHSRPAHEVR